MTKHSRARAAILIVNGFDRGGHWGPYNSREAIEYPWVGLCLRQIRRHTKEDEADIFIYDNSRLAQHRDLMRRARVAAIFPPESVVSVLRPLDRLWPAGADRWLAKPHAVALDYLVTKLSDSYRWLVTLDTDSFPVCDDWLGFLTSRVGSGAAVVGVWRDEMRERIRPFVHVSGLCMEQTRFRRLHCSFSRAMGQDVGQNITEELFRCGETVIGLPRTNVDNPHYLMSGIYGNTLYHHGAGSRRAAFWTSRASSDEESRVRLMRRAFEDLEGLVRDLMKCEYGALPPPVASIQSGS